MSFSVALNPRSVFCRNQYPDNASWSEALYRGGAVPGEDFHLGQVTGYYGDQLRMICDEPPDPLSNSDYTQIYQAQRPDTFVKKLPSRRWAERSSRASSSTPSTSTFITKKKFAEHYGAAAFAAHSGLHCETAVTIWWGALGAVDAGSAQGLFSAFTKDVNDWLCQRHLPTVYFFSHENSPRVGLHTHLAVYLELLPIKLGRMRRIRPL